MPEHTLRDEETGRIKRRWSDDELLEIVRGQTEEQPFTGVSSVADALDANQNGIRNRLNELVEKDRLLSRQITENGAYIYWLPDDEERQEGGAG